MISWFNRKQSSVTLSTAQAKYIAACSTYSEAVWIYNMLAGLFHVEIDVTNIRCDNHISIKMTKNLVFQDKLKHIENRYHYIRDMVQKGAVKLKYVPTKE